MFDLLDLVSPRVYVVSDSEYKEYKERKNKARIEALEHRRDHYLDYVKKLEEEIEELKK